MNRLTSYVLRQSLGITLFVTVGLTAAAWLIQSLKLVELVVDHGVGIGTFIALAGLSLPQLLILSLPIGCFIGVQFTFSKLSSDSELIVMRACGLSQRKLAKSALILAIGATLFTYALTLYLSPASKNAFKDLQFQVRNQFSSEVLQEGNFNQLSDTLTVYIRARDPEGRLRGLLIQDTHDPAHILTLSAEQGMIATVNGAPRVLMLNGTRQTWDAQEHQLSVLTFDRWSLDLDQYRDVPGARWEQPDERYIQDLFFPKDADKDPAWRMRLWVEGHNRLVTPLYCLSFIFIALATLLTGEHNRRGRTQRIVVAYFLVAVSDALSVAIMTFADRHPIGVLFMYLNPLVPLAISVLILIAGDGALPALLPTRRAEAAA